MERYNMTRKILKSNFDVENVYGLGVQSSKDTGRPEFYQIQRKVQDDNIDF